ncbi:MAG: hypothetical protein COU06_00835 [Candidatus Harrisonbacteria bacterium CG10_big_fil_rev_8_21_14_0_10_38_8]|uniref:Uncharacterized protein n=1 Tax=Candidatus Harrisonbacteria bacterium CG10_big_fil_rev_8_21_14_0_10_38_8 TaxID=1974582 RepID=A0A2M6WKI5_9BACT|nr:MAG: hypothetical protein COU06_00835 [Candidatus Harrisonbacteria bacterium CG10_big_fil_rev_8_21_14_0_10_38_8]
MKMAKSLMGELPDDKEVEKVRLSLESSYSAGYTKVGSLTPELRMVYTIMNRKEGNFMQKQFYKKGRENFNKVLAQLLKMPELESKEVYISTDWSVFVKN